MSDENANKTTRPWMPLAVLGGVLVLLVVLALAVTWTRDSSDDDAPATESGNAETAESAPSVTATDAEDFAAECQASLETEDAGIEDKAPSVDQWVSVGYNVVPMSTGHGGCQESDSGLRTGFAHTDAGALMAATTYAIGVSPSGMNGEARIEESVIEGADKDELIERAESISRGETDGADAEALRSADIQGYDVRELSDDRASFTIYLEISDGSGQRMTAAGQADLVWEDGDWKIDPASGSELMTVSEAASEPSVEWGPNDA